MKLLKPAILLFVLPYALLAPGGGWAAPAPLPAEAAKVARDFVFAFARNDRDAISAMLPKSREDRYGPCPFSRVPTLKTPIVDGSSAKVYFDGRPESGLPGKGVLILRQVKSDNVKTWRVRQIYWYDQLPPEAKKSEKSSDSADRKQEPAVREAAEDFLGAWLAGDYERLEARVFRWWERNRDAPGWVRMTKVDLKSPKESLGATRVDFVAKLVLLRTIPKRVNGTLWLVHESDGSWRVRPLTIAFDF